MSEPRQKIRINPALQQADMGESHQPSLPGFEELRASSLSESPAIKNLMEAIVERSNCIKALERVRKNKGSAGIDGLTVDKLPGYLKDNWLEIRSRLLSGCYRPQAVKRVEIPKPGGGVRKLGVPTVVDRFVQQLVLQVLQGIWDPTFSDHSYGFRPNRSCHQAVRKAQEYLKSGCNWVVDLDLEKFFDRVKVSVTQFIEKKLLLKVNQQKSAVDRPSRRKFLGFSFTGNRKRRIARESIARFKQTVRQLTRRTQGVDIESMVKRLSLYLGGWNGYYGLCETPSVLEGLQGWMRRRLRSFLWKQWKTSGNRFKQLTQRGVGIELAAQTVGSCHGPWRLACSPALGKALGNHYFRDLGLPDLKVKYS